MLRIFQKRKPHHSIDSISFNGKSWELHKTTGHTDIYDRIQIRLDAGFFMMLTLYKNNQKKNIIVFYDQITKDECRHFYLVEKLVQNL